MKGLIITLLLILMTLPLFSLTLEEGNMKLVVDEESGGFVLYRRASRQSSWFALMEESYSGSYFSVYSDGDWVNLVLEESVDKRFETDGLSIRCVYDYSTFQVDLTLELIQYGQTELQNYLLIKGRLINQEDSMAGLRFLLDTGFSRDSEHFLVEGRSIRSERLWSDPLPSWILNRGSAPEDKLYILPHPQYPKPDSLILANWYRLDQDSNETYSLSSGRSFDELPFSRDDAAVAYYWNPRRISSANPLSFSLLFGVNEPLLSEPEEEKHEEIDSASYSLRKQMIEDQLDYIDEFLDELSYIEESGQSLSENDIVELTNTLENLKSKKIEYEGIQ